MLGDLLSASACGAQNPFAKLINDAVDTPHFSLTMSAPVFPVNAEQNELSQSNNGTADSLTPNELRSFFQVLFNAAKQGIPFQGFAYLTYICFSFLFFFFLEILILRNL